ncbi:hypothetical protein [Nevskia sp.]|uniref:hypothetical protein n=1 Tax=Nevskia sp. TaxID=1929292 RepID=UPI0025CFB9A3|nr:hypothetical protein [Nevskia sp.]
MSSEPTVFIVGAGASCELNFPIGEKLGSQISEMSRIRWDSLNRTESPANQEFFRLAGFALSGRDKYLGDTSGVTAKLRKLSEGVHLTYSIDNYLALHSLDETLVELGKIAIAYQIADFERGSPLQVFPLNGIHKPRVLPVATWYGRLFKAITSQCKFEDIADRFRNVCIICFNYDRNIQRFFLLAIQGLYGVNEEKALEALKSLPIWHPYGSLGALPGLAEKDTREYGPALTADSLRAMAGGLKTFTEGCGGSTGISQSLVAGYMRRANRFVVLGFGFLPDNMKLLKEFMRDIRRSPGEQPLVFGTSFQISEFDRAQHAYQLADLLHTPRQSVHLADTTCADLFVQFSRALRFEN